MVSWKQIPEGEGPPPAASAPSSIAVAILHGVESSGDLATTSFGQVYAAAALASATTSVQLTVRGYTVAFYFRRGAIEGIHSTNPDDSIGSFLAAKGLVTVRALADATAAAQKIGSDLVAYLFQHNMVSTGAALEQIAARGLGIVAREFAARQGSYVLHAKPPPASLVFPIGSKWIVFTAASRMMPLDVVRRDLAPWMSVPLLVARESRLSELNFGPQEARAVTAFDGRKTLSELSETIDESTLLRAAWMLRALGYLNRADTPESSGATTEGAHHQSPSEPTRAAPPEARPPPKACFMGRPQLSAPSRVVRVQDSRPRPVASAPSGATQPPKPPRSRPTSAAIPLDLPGITALLAKYKSQNYFEVLGVTKDAPPNAVKGAYLALARSFHPDTLPAGTPADVTKVRSDIFALIGQAQRTLSDTSQRAVYISELEFGAVGQKVDVAALLEADELFHKASQMVQARNFSEALPILEKVVAVNSDHGEYVGYYAYTRLMVSPTSAKAAATAKELITATTMSPHSAWLQYFLGTAYKLAADPLHAKAAYAKSLQLDPQHLDAQRDLRLLK